MGSVSWAGFVPLHGIGGAKDLPVPAGLAIGGGMAALLASFAVLAVAWRSPRYVGEPRQRRVPPGLAQALDSTWLTGAVRVFGLLFFGYLTWALVAGPDLITNPVLGTFYVLVWVGIVPFSLAFGQVVRALSPLRTIHLLLVRMIGGSPERGVLRYPERLGYWPAAAGLFAFVWQELVDPRSAYLGTVRNWLIIYALVVLVGALLFGTVWFERADPFEVYSGLIARLSFWARDDDGIRVWRSPLANLATRRPAPGQLAVLAVLFGSTGFDTYKDTVSWIRFTDKHASNVQVFDTVALLVFCGVVGITFTIAAMSTAVEPGGLPRRALPAYLAPSITPIVVGYMTAHYLSYFVEQGQTTLIQLSDPMGSGANLLGTADFAVDYFLSLHPPLLATLKVLAVVAGHVLGVIAAHDRALAVLPRRHHVTGQVGMLVIMVCYTGVGLYLLFGAA